jgi:hypothetical protein
LNTNNKTRAKTPKKPTTTTTTTKNKQQQKTNNNKKQANKKKNEKNPKQHSTAYLHILDLILNAYDVFTFFIRVISLTERKMVPVPYKSNGKDQ